MYTPKHFAEARLPVLHQWMRENSFATIVSMVEGAPFATHLPVLVDSSRGAFGVLRAHMAKANPHWATFAEDSELLVIFQGPHGYVTPSWYESMTAVPTWNYTAVHAYGLPRILGGEAALDLLREQVTFYESSLERPWDLASQPAGYIEGMAKGVVAFEIEVTRLEGKGKLSQNRPIDRDRVITALRARRDRESVALAGSMREAADRG